MERRGKKKKGETWLVVEPTRGRIKKSGVGEKRHEACSKKKKLNAGVRMGGRRTGAEPAASRFFPSKCRRSRF